MRGVSHLASYSLLAIFFVAPISRAETQVDAISQAMAVQKAGSDQDLRNSTTSAMTALMHLGHGNYNGALQNGYKAFGEYRTSGDLDSLRLKGAISALKMDSIGNYLSANKNAPFMAPISDFETSYRRLDPKFLREGEAGKIAAQFEKETGMSRDTFLKRMAAASESDIKMSDPNLVDKVLSRFEGFVNDIPNDAFRENVKKEIAKVPSSMRTGIIAKAVQKASQLVAGASSAPTKADLAGALGGDIKGREPASSGAGATKPAASSAAPTSKPVDSRQLMAAAGAAANLNGRPEFSRIDTDKFGSDAVGNALQTAIDEQQGDDSIFKQISRKYRSLTVSLTQRAL
jgi:hypothetical protein